MARNGEYFVTLPQTEAKSLPENYDHNIKDFNAPKMQDYSIGEIIPSQKENHDFNYSITNSYIGSFSTQRMFEIDEDIEIFEFFYEEFAKLYNEENITFLDVITKFQEYCFNFSHTNLNLSEISENLMEKNFLFSKSQLLTSEYNSWVLVRHLFQPTPEIVYPEGMDPNFESTEKIALDYIFNDNFAITCMRIINWLEEIFSKKLEFQKLTNGSYIGIYSPSLGTYHHTKKFNQINSKSNVVKHVDFDSTTRENRPLHVEDEKFELCLIEDLLKLFEAGKFDEAIELCCNAGQPWRAMILNTYSNFNPLIQSKFKTDQNRKKILALEEEIGKSKQRKLWKYSMYRLSEKLNQNNSQKSKVESALFSSFCSNIDRVLPICKDWKSALLAITRSSFDYCIDQHIKNYFFEHDLNREKNEKRSGKSEEIRFAYDATSATNGWPKHVSSQQCFDPESIFKKLSSSDFFDFSFKNDFDDFHHKIQYFLILNDVPGLLNLIDKSTSYISNYSQSHILRFSCHLILILRKWYENKIEILDILGTKGDVIIHRYSKLLYEQKQEILFPFYVRELTPLLGNQSIISFIETMNDRNDEYKEKFIIPAIEIFYTKGFCSITEISNDAIERSIFRKRNLEVVQNFFFKNEIENRFQILSWFLISKKTKKLDDVLFSEFFYDSIIGFCNLLIRGISLQNLFCLKNYPIDAKHLFKKIQNFISIFDEIAVHFSKSVTKSEYEHWKIYFSYLFLFWQWEEKSKVNQKFSISQLSDAEKTEEISLAQTAMAEFCYFISEKSSTWLDADITPSHIEEETNFISLYSTRSTSIRLVLEAHFFICNDDDTDGDSIQKANMMDFEFLKTQIFNFVGEEQIRKWDFDVNVNEHPDDKFQMEVTFHCAYFFPENFEFEYSNARTLLAKTLSHLINVYYEGNIKLRVSYINSFVLSDFQNRKHVSPLTLFSLHRHVCLPNLALKFMDIQKRLASLVQSDDEYKEDIVILCLNKTKIHEYMTKSQLKRMLFKERECQVERKLFEEKSQVNLMIS